EAAGGVLWFKRGEGFHATSHSHFVECGYQSSEAQRESIDAALQDVEKNRRPLLLGPSDEEGHYLEEPGGRLVNLCGEPFVFWPAVQEGMGMAGNVPVVIHLWLLPSQFAGRFRDVIGFLQTAGDRLAKFLEAKRLENLETNTQSLQQLLQLATQL